MFVITDKTGTRQVCDRCHSARGKFAAGATLCRECSRKERDMRAAAQKFFAAALEPRTCATCGGDLQPANLDAAMSATALRLAAHICWVCRPLAASVVREMAAERVEEAA